MPLSCNRSRVLFDKEMLLNVYLIKEEVKKKETEEHNIGGKNHIIIYSYKNMELIHSFAQLFKISK